MKNRIAAAALAALLSTTAHAAQISTMMANGNVGIMISGRIVDGDAARFRQVRASASGPIRFVGLNSGGGSVNEAEQIASIVNADASMIIVGAGNDCASACFLILAAGATKTVSEGAHIGVHGASAGPGSSVESANGTIEMARRASTYGVPDAIIGKMAITPNARVAWLSPDDLRSMGANVVPVEQAAAAAAPPLEPIDTPNPYAPKPSWQSAPVAASAPAPVEPYYASLSSDRQRLVDQTAAVFMQLYRTRGLPGVNSEISACLEQVVKVRTLRVLEYCSALDLVAMAVAKTDVGFNSGPSVDARTEWRKRFVVIPTAKNSEWEAFAMATILRVNKELAQ